VITKSLFTLDGWQELSTPARFLFIAILAYADENGLANPSFRQLCCDTAIRKNKLNKLLVELESINLITRRKGFSSNNIYQISGVAKTETVATVVPTGVPLNATVVPTGVPLNATVVPTGVPPPTIYKHLKDKNNKTLKDKRTIVRTPKVWPETSPEYWLAAQLWANIQRSGTMMKPPNLQTWASDIDLMHRVDSRPYDLIRVTMSAVRKDPFWIKNIKAPSKLRSQLNKGNLDLFVPAEGEYMADDEFISKVQEVLNDKK
jgi:hypothetical protein